MSGEVLYPIILFRARTRLCALPVGHVLETMRPLPIEALAAAPEFVIGVSLVRGAAMPVVDVGALLGAGEAPAFTRYLTLRTGEASVALAVEAVAGVREVGSASLSRLPPLLRGADAEMLSALSSLDSELLTVLRFGRSLTERAFRALQTQGGAT